MISEQQFTESLDPQLSPTEKAQLYEMVRPFYDFNEYICLKLGQTEAEVEALSSAYSKQRMAEYQPYFEELLQNPNPDRSPIEETILVTAKIYGEFAREHGYEAYEALETSMATYLQMMMLQNFHQGLEEQPEPEA